MDVKTPGASYFMLRRAIALLIASLAASEAARAACDPPSTASSATVNCSGDTLNSGPDAGVGYGTFDDNNNTYNIQAGATVTGDDTGVRFGTGATFNVSGTITGGKHRSNEGSNGRAVLEHSSKNEPVAWGRQADLVKLVAGYATPLAG